METFPIEPTQELHQRLLSYSRDSGATLAEVFARVNEEITGMGVSFERRRAMTVAPSALVLTPTGEKLLRDVGETLYAIVEKAIDTLLADQASFARLFPEHQRMSPWLRKTRGLDSWQGYSRYDVVVTPEGRIRVIELNTCCPAGFSHAEIISSVTRGALDCLGVLDNDQSEMEESPVIGSIPFDAIFDELLAVEKKAGLQPRCIALVNDENNLVHELDRMARALQDRGREVLITSASDLRYDHTRNMLLSDKQPISLVYNKIRVSTPESPNHCWRPGFGERYEDFLTAIASGAVASVNGPAAWTVAEDKTLLQWLTSPEFLGTLSGQHRQFIENTISPTTRLVNEITDWEGRSIDPIRYAIENREQLVLKPANEGRGFGVTIGTQTPASQWEEACLGIEPYPRIIQRFSPMARFPVVDVAGGGPCQMYWTIGLFVMRGKYRGALSRISPNPVNNIGRQGHVQAIIAGRD